MITADVAYATGFLAAPFIIGILAAVWYARRGWPRGTGPGWRARVRQAVAVLIGLYTIAQVAVVVVNGTGDTSPSSTSTPMGVWATKNMTPYIRSIGNDLRALKRAATVRSRVGINNACFNGLANVNAAATKPRAPDAHFERLYDTWLVDTYQTFAYCHAASMTQARWLSTAGTQYWAKAVSYSAKADKALSKTVAYGDTLKM